MGTGTEAVHASPVAREPGRVDFLGSPVDRLTLSDTLEWMCAAIERRVPRRVVSLNAKLLYEMSRDARLRDIVRDADLIVPEWAVVWGARQLGLPALSFVPGVVVTRRFLEEAAGRGFRPYLLGSRPEVVSTLAERLKRDHGLQVAGFHHGYFETSREEREVLQDIRRACPDVLFAGLGSPKQEYWLRGNQSELGVPVAMGIGGSFDVLAGFKPDTPAWARGHGLEWLYRTWLDPKAYGKRYLVTNTWFLVQVARARLTRRPSVRRPGGT